MFENAQTYISPEMRNKVNWLCQNPPFSLLKLLYRYMILYFILNRMLIWFFSFFLPTKDRELFFKQDTDTSAPIRISTNAQKKSVPCWNLKNLDLLWWSRHRQTTKEPCHAGMLSLWATIWLAQIFICRKFFKVYKPRLSLYFSNLAFGCVKSCTFACEFGGKHRVLHLLVNLVASMRADSILD